MNRETRAIVECILFVSSEPVDIATLTRVSGLSEAEIRSAIKDLREIYRRGGHSLDVVDINEGWQLCTRPEYSGYVEKLFPSPRRGLSQAALETLSIIAYKQPITRAEIERIRGVKVGKVLQTLLEKGLIAEKGRKDSPGKPLLYGTTTKFLHEFNLRDLNDLPQVEVFVKGQKQQLKPS